MYKVSNISVRILWIALAAIGTRRGGRFAQLMLAFTTGCLSIKFARDIVRTIHTPSTIRVKITARSDAFTYNARNVISSAKEEATSFNHSYVGTEHILIGLLKAENGVAARTLRNLDVDLDKVRTAIESFVGRGESPIPGESGFTPRAKGVMANAFDEARGRGSGYVDTEHILLGLIRQEDAVGIGILHALNVSSEDIRSEISNLLANGTSGSQGES